MSDLLSALVQRSKQVADPVAAAYASGNRPFRVRLTRPHVVATYSRDLRQFINPDDAPLYLGRARITTAAGGSEMEIGDERMTISAARASIDQYKGPMPRIDDLLEVLSTPQSTQTHLAGRVFKVDSVEVGGHFGIGYVLLLSGVAPSRRG